MQKLLIISFEENRGEEKKGSIKKESMPVKEKGKDAKTRVISSGTNLTKGRGDGIKPMSSL